MSQHISIRVPWHDHDWDGTVCTDPANNNACLRLRNIAEKRNDKVEIAICGHCMTNHVDDLSCVGEGAGFMSPVEIVTETIHPYKESSKNTHGHFLPTVVIYPAYSFPCRPFAWTMKHNIERLKDVYNIDYCPEREPALGFDTIWVQEAQNQKAIFDCFYGDVVENESLCIAYAKQVPFVEDNRRVVVAVGHVKKIIPAVEHNHTNEKSLRSMTWETMICHSIRENHEDGFVIPYRQMMKYAEDHPDFDMSSITVFAPNDAFEEFSYATEHVSYDAVIEVIQSCIKAFSIINECLDEDYTNVLDWLNCELSKVWEDRGAFPGLGAMLCALGISQGIIVAKRMQEGIEKDCDFWKRLDALIADPKDYLEPLFAKTVTPILQETWKKMPDERKILFKLLSRFSLDIEQADILFHESDRKKNDINCTDREIINNPYIVYEQTRMKAAPLCVSVRKVDRAVFPVPSILEKYPLEAPTALTSDNDERRVRAIAVAVLENEASNGNTIFPCNMMLDKIQEMILDPKCKVTQDILNAISKFLSKEILCREMKDGTEYYKLVRMNEFDKVIERCIKKRICAKKLEIDVDWRKLLDEKFGKGELDFDEERARCEKAAVLNELARSRIGVLVGGAGTGKTTVLSVLCNQPDIKVGGVLLLAPTGKATVRLMDSLGDDAKNFTALNVAQFLTRSKRFDWYDMRYKLSDYDYRDVPETVIIDEASMLTEEMLGALIQALKSAKRIIFMGDPNQLPPIGAGRAFVDLIKLLRPEPKFNVFPRVCNCYGELTVNRRQNSDKIRLDVELARLFANEDEATDEDVIAKIAKGNDYNISIVTWFDKDDLEEKLLQIMAQEIGMTDVDDQEGFDSSLGGKKSGNRVYFNTGCAVCADKWQILSPVRNMPQGVMNINRLIHLKYRENLLAISKKPYFKNKKIPIPLGSEGIIYGDKVINVTNSKRIAYPENGSRNYIANGEIGIAREYYSNPKERKYYLKIEFSSQKGFLYSYTKKDFDDEFSSAPLELAYALTVHKSQGSQFDTVILVLAEPCCIISRELLYTSLTRQVNKIIILYNQEAYHLLKYSSEEYSDIAKRFTDLFADVFHDSDKDMRPQIVQVGNQFYEEKLIHRTIRGEFVRSKSEVIIANVLHNHNLRYYYEPELVLEGKIYRPDFKIEDADTGDVWYWEHCGMMDNPKYKKRWENKKAFYKKNGIEEGKNLIVTYDEDGSLDSYKLDEIIKEMFE